MRHAISSLERRTPILLGLLALITFGVFVRVLGADFVLWDDPQLVYENPLVILFSPRIFWSFDPELFIPLTLLTYQIEHAIFGFEPFIFHLTNLSLHIGNVMLVFWLFTQWQSSRLLAFLGALLFAIHPLNTEAVAWVSARKDLLSMLFFLLSLNFYIQCRTTLSLPARMNRSDGSKGEGKQSRSLLLSLLFFLLALLSKVTAVTLPIVLLLVDYTKGPSLSVRSVREKWSYFLLAIVFGIVALFGKTMHLLAIGGPALLLLSGKSMAFALLKFFVPVQLSVLYPQKTALSIASPDVLLSLVAIAVIVVSCFLLRRRRDLFFGLAFFVITFLPGVLTFSKSGGIYFFSDRYAYVPMVGLLFLLLAIVQRISQRRALALCCGVGVVAVVIAIIFAGMSAARTRVWINTETLLTDVLTKYPQAQAAYTNLGKHYLDEGDPGRAQEFLESSMQISPVFAIVHNNLGLAYLEQGRTEEALVKFQTAIAIDPDYAHAWVNLGVWHGRAGNFGAAEEALQRAIELDPLLAQAHFNLAGVYQMRGEIDRSLATYERTLKIDPYHLDARLQIQKLIGNL